jgi:hypothetical protein
MKEAEVGGECSTHIDVVADARNLWSESLG